MAISKGVDTDSIPHDLVMYPGDSGLWYNWLRTEVTVMEQTIHEGTAQELAPYLAQNPERRFRLIEITEEPSEEPVLLPDPQNAASIALLKSWIAQAPTDPVEIRAAEAELLEFKRNMNLPRKEAGARLLYPEAE
jgi:hypothetical protein